MAISGINVGNGQPRITPQVVAEAVAPAALQAAGPQDTLGIKSKTQPGKGFSASTRLADLKPEQKASLGGGAALDTIATAQPSTTVGEVGPLLRNRGALDTIAGLMENRRDLKVGDFVSQDKKGRVSIDPSYKDPQTMELLKERQDITPSEITAMRQNMARTLKNPHLGKEAAQKSFNLLKKRSDLKPEDMSKMLGSMRTAAGGDNKSAKQGGAGDEAGAMAALDMFDKASKVMEKRTDLGPDRMGEMAQAVGQMSDPKDKQGPQSVAEGFEAASKSLGKNALRKPEEMVKMAQTVGDNMKGGGEKSGQMRMNAFKKSADMMGENTSVDAASVNKMFKQANQRDPKIKNGEGDGRNKRLAKVMDDVSTGVKNGTVAADDLSSHFRNQDAERARFAKDDPNRKKKTEEAKKKEEQKKPGESKSEESKKSEQTGQTESKDKTGKPNEAPKAEGDKPAAKSDATDKTDKPEVAAKVDSDKSESSKTDAPNKPEAFAEEEGAKPAARPGEGPAISAAEAAAAGPGEAAGTTSAGTPVGTTGKGGKGPQQSQQGQGGVAQGVQPVVKKKQ